MKKYKDIIICSFYSIVTFAPLMFVFMAMVSRSFGSRKYLIHLESFASLLTFFIIPPLLWLILRSFTKKYFRIANDVAASYAIIAFLVFFTKFFGDMYNDSYINIYDARFYELYIPIFLIYSALNIAIILDVVRTKKVRLFFIQLFSSDKETD